MKKKLLICLLLLSSFVFAQNSASWYKQIAGSIDKYPITMHLHKAGHNYYGYYYYESQQKPVYFNGEDTSVKDKIRLIAFATSESTETFTFSVSNATVNGHWKKDEKNKAVVFTGTEANPVIPLTYVYTEGEKKLRPKINPVAAGYVFCRQHLANRNIAT